MSILSLSNKTALRSIRASLFLVVMFQVACIGGVCLCNAAEVDCDQLLSNEALQQYDFDKEQIKKMQISMEDPDWNKSASGNNTPPDDEETGVAPSPEASEDGSLDTESVQQAREDGVGVVYQLTEENVVELTDSGVPEGVIERLKELQDVEYENDNLFKAGCRI
ncbi:MAG: hypothetical protein JRC86_08485 [Deltaproteobacteria bacterium]|nr:hypothetical protein [Deltaproteobacteria bacterium]